MNDYDDQNVSKCTLLYVYWSEESKAISVSFLIYFLLHDSKKVLAKLEIKFNGSKINDHSEFYIFYLSS